LDAALASAACRRGRVIEIFGRNRPENHHRSAGGRRPRRRRDRSFYRVEHALDPAYARKLGVDIDKSAGFAADYASRR